MSASRTLADKLRLVVSGEKIYNILHTGNKELIKPADIGAVSKTGDTMTEDLLISKAAGPSVRLNTTGNGAGGVVQMGVNQLLLAARDQSNNIDNSRILTVNNATRDPEIAKAIRLIDRVNGVETYYDLLHTGNMHLYGLAAVPASVE